MCPVFNRGGGGHFWGFTACCSWTTYSPLDLPRGAFTTLHVFQTCHCCLSTQDVHVSKHRPVWCQWVDILFRVQTGVSAARRLVRPRFVAAVINQIWAADSPHRTRRACIWVFLLLNSLPCPGQRSLLETKQSHSEHSHVLLPWDRESALLLWCTTNMIIIMSAQDPMHNVWMAMRGVYVP